MVALEMAVGVLVCSPSVPIAVEDQGNPRNRQKAQTHDQGQNIDLMQQRCEALIVWAGDSAQRESGEVGGLADCGAGAFDGGADASRLPLVPSLAPGVA